MSNEDFFQKIARLMQERNNPADLKPSIIGKVVKLDPLTIQIEDGKVLLVENEELEISEWFRFRCNIDKTGALSSDIPSFLNSAKNIQEVHSQGGAACNMSKAINYLCNAVNAITNELLSLKCTLQLDDYVSIASLEELNKYILTDKVI